MSRLSDLTKANTLRLVITALFITTLVSACTGNKRSAQKKATKDDLSSQNNKGISQIQLTANFRDAAFQGQSGLVEQMIDDIADIDLSDDNGNTALMLASFNGHVKVIEILLSNGANINKKDVNGRTALMFASSGPFPEAVNLLLKKGANINDIDNVEKWSALMFAAAEGNNEVIKTLIKKGADINMSDIDGESAYDFAVNNGHTETAKLIKEAGK